MSANSIDPAQLSEPVGMPGVYLVPAAVLRQYALPWFVAGRPVRAWAPHPDRDDVLYLTIEHPACLAFLPDPYVELE